jgi:Ca2+/Na+ antiporter
VFGIIIIIIIGKDTISFTQGIYTYVPETDHVRKEYNVAAILSLLFMAPISLAPVLALMYLYISTYYYCYYYYYYYDYHNHHHSRLYEGHLQLHTGNKPCV